MTFESTLHTLCAYGGLVEAHEALGLLAHDEFPERYVYLTAVAAQQIRALPSSPGEEDPDVPSQDQVEDLIARFLRGGRMFPKRDYQEYDRRRCVWKWKTRSVRIAGVYLSRKHFVLARAGFARGLKRGGKSVTEFEKAFVDAAYQALELIGLDQVEWLKEDPHSDSS